MNKKKVLAFVLATTMVLGTSMSVFAAEQSDPGVNSEGETVTGTGDVDYVDTTVYEVELPTTSSITLKVDPQGLLGMTGDTATKEDLEDYAGLIPGEDISAVTNLSSVPMKVSVALKLTGDATGVTEVDNVNSGTTANVLLYAVPSAVDTQGDEENYVASTKGVVLTASGVSIDFVLPAADYVFKKDTNVTYEVVEGSGHGTALSFGGYVNTGADWSDYVSGGGSSIGMEAVFTFTKEVGTTTADSTEGAPYAMAAYSGDVVTVAPAEAAPSIATTTYEYTTGQAVEIPVNLGAGELAATGISSITINVNGTSTALATTRYSFADGKLTFTADYINLLAGITRQHTIKFNDTDATTVVITLKPEE